MARISSYKYNVLKDKPSGERLTVLVPNAFFHCSFLEQRNVRDIKSNEAYLGMSLLARQWLRNGRYSLMLEFKHSACKHNNFMVLNK